MVALREEHPAYALLSVREVGVDSLFGADGVDRALQVEVREASVDRTEVVGGRSVLVLQLSKAQLAAALFGDEVPCTLRERDGTHVGAPPRTSARERQLRAFREDLASLLSPFLEKAREFTTLLEGGSQLSREQRKEIGRLLLENAQALKRLSEGAGEALGKAADRLL